MILRKGLYKYSTSEIGKDYEKKNETKLLKERELKNLKMLKDMLVDLGNFAKWKPNKLHQLELVSFIYADKYIFYIYSSFDKILNVLYHISLHIILLHMDVFASYICRISRYDTLQIPADVKYFKNVVKCMILTWKVKVSINTLLLQ